MAAVVAGESRPSRFIVGFGRGMENLQGSVWGPPWIG